MNIIDLLNQFKEEFKLTPLKEIADLARGKNLTKKEFIPGDIPVVSGGKNITGYHNLANREGDIISVASSGAYAGTIHYWSNPIYVSDAFSIKSKGENVLTSFIYYCLKNHQDYFYSLSRGMIPHFYIKDIQDFLIPLPSLETQKAIVAILDNLEEISKNYQYGASLKEKAFLYYLDSLFNSSNDNKSEDFSCSLKNSSGSTIKSNELYNDKEAVEYSLKEEVQWIEADELFVIKKGYTPSTKNKAFYTNGTVPWFRLEDIRANGRMLDRSIKLVNKSAVTGGKLIPANSLIMSTSATIGEHALIKVPFITNQSFTCFTLKDKYKDYVDIMYLYYFFFEFAEWCKFNAIKGGILNRINLDPIKKFKIPLPSLETQKAIVKSLDALDITIESYKKAGTSYKKALNYTTDLLFNNLLAESQEPTPASA